MYDFSRADDIELMGSWLRNVVDSMKEEAKKIKSVKIMMPEGKAEFGPSGVTWVDTGKGTGIQTPSTTSSKAQTVLKDIVSNPLFFGIAVSVAFMILRDRGKR